MLENLVDFQKSSEKLIEFDTLEKERHILLAWEEA
jgi:hypothetical protein